MYERVQIKEHAPQFNKAQMPNTPCPWKYALLPKDKDWDTWCNALGARQMAARVVLAKGRVVEQFGIDYDWLVNKVKPTLSAQTVPTYAL